MITGDAPRSSTCINGELNPGVLQIPLQDEDTPDSRTEYYLDIFRILSILPGSFDDKIECQMRHAYLQHEDEGLTVCGRNPGGEAPEYEALSYVWGVDKDTTTITIDGFEVEIGKNLECALRHLPLKTESRSIWVGRFLYQSKSS
jgi:hypothetical protein